MMSQLRLLIDRLRGRETVLPVDVSGRRILVAAGSRRELRRARSLSREAEILGRMIEHLSPGDIVYDVGANIGLVSLALAAHAPDGGIRIHAFEPEPSNFRRLRRNIELNGIRDRVVAHDLALGAAEGEADLHVRPGAGEGRHSIATDRKAKFSIRVPLSTVTSVAEASGEPPDFLKIDVEGAEGQVLAGMDGLIGRRRPRELFMEIHPKGGGEGMPGGERIGDWLGERGYSLVWERRQGSQVQRHYR